MENSAGQIRQERLAQLDGLLNYTSNIRKDVTFLLQSLGWDSEHITAQDAKKLCPFDKSHMINESKFDDHVAKCRSRKNYYADDLPLPDNSNTDPATSIFIDSSLVTSVIENAKKIDANFQSNVPNVTLEPHEIVTASQMVSNYTRDERRAIYDHLMTKAPSTQVQVDSLSCQIQESSSSKSHLEELAQTRDLKRRRMKYKVSTKSKSYTDVIREVLENQMLSLNPASNTMDQEMCGNTKYGGHEKKERDVRNDTHYVKRNQNKYEEDDNKNRNNYYSNIDDATDRKYGRHDQNREKIKKSHEFASSKRKKSNNKEFYDT